MILVVGATGTLGRKLSRSLLAAGEDVRVMTRIVARTDDLKALGARPVRGDLRDPDSLEFALRGATTVVAAAHSILGRGEEASEHVDDAGHRNLIDAAKRAGVEHFVYTSVMGATLDHPLDFWRTKAGIERYLRASGMSFTIVRPTAFMEMHAYELIGKPVLEGKRVMLFGAGRNPRNFVAAEDVATTIVGALRDPGLRGEVIEIGGPENLSGHDVVKVFERVGGRKAKVGHIPLPVVRAGARAMRRVHPGASRIMRLGVLNETTNQTFDPSTLGSRVPISLTKLGDWARNRLVRV